MGCSSRDRTGRRSARTEMTTPHDRLEEETLDVQEVRERAVTGTALVAMRGLAIRGLAFLGNIVLARLLVPRDFGLVAFGTSVMTIATFLTAAGIGAGLIRRPEAP